jgi:cell division protein FtsI/penicillin-binding protein 2
MAIAVDPNTGAVLAVAARPDFEPNNYEAMTLKVGCFSGHIIF